MREGPGPTVGVPRRRPVAPAVSLALALAAGPADAASPGAVHLLCSEAGGVLTVRYSSNWDLPGSVRVFVRMVDADRCTLARAVVELPLADGAAATLDLSGRPSDRRCAARAPLEITATLADPAAASAARGAPACRLRRLARPGT